MLETLLVTAVTAVVLLALRRVVVERVVVYDYQKEP